MYLVFFPVLQIPELETLALLKKYRIMATSVQLPSPLYSFSVQSQPLFGVAVQHH